MGGLSYSTISVRCWGVGKFLYCVNWSTIQLCWTLFTLFLFDGILIDDSVATLMLVVTRLGMIADFIRVKLLDALIESFCELAFSHLLTHVGIAYHRKERKCRGLPLLNQWWAL